MAKILICIDCQVDFVKPEGNLSNENTIKIISNIVKRIEKARQNNEKVIFTQDTHYNSYLSTQEGQNLPIDHCIYEANGWKIVPEIDTKNDLIFTKETFGSLDLAKFLQIYNKNTEVIDSIEVCGVCTDICVISNCLILKAALPEVKIIVNPILCAGTSKRNHNAAIEVMKSCQIDIVED